MEQRIDFDGSESVFLSTKLRFCYVLGTAQAYLLGDIAWTLLGWVGALAKSSGHVW